MITPWEYSPWHSAYRDAVLELAKPSLDLRIGEARVLIDARTKELTDINQLEHAELGALKHSLNVLRMLEETRL